MLTEVEQIQCVCDDKEGIVLGAVVQSIVSLTTSLRRQFVKYMLTKLSDTVQSSNIAHLRSFNTT